MLNLIAPITCAEYVRNVTTSTGETSLITVALRQPGNDTAQASYDASDIVVC
jgi:hypothetical protein